MATLAMILAGMSVGCGYSEEEYQAQVHGRERAEADLKAAQKQITDDKSKFDSAMAQQEKLKSDLKKLGVDLDAAKTNAENLEAAIAEYKERADQLAAIEERFRESQAAPRQAELSRPQGRRPQQPHGDPAPGRHPLRLGQGRAQAARQGGPRAGRRSHSQRRDLSTRNFQVAGHTDNAKYPAAGAFKDNWGLSLARARQVLLFL